MHLGGLFVKYFPGPSYTKKLKVNESDTVRDFKKMIQKQEGISTENKALRFKERQLQDDRVLLSYYDIRDETILHLEGKRELA